MIELTQIAAELIEAFSCIEIKKVSKGNFNKIFLLIINDENEVIAKILNSNAEHSHFITVSEVVTMNFIHNFFLLCLVTVVNKMLAGKKCSENTDSQSIYIKLLTERKLSQCWIHSHEKGVWY